MHGTLKMIELMAYPPQWLGTGPLFTGVTVLVCVDMLVLMYPTMIICFICVHCILALRLRVNNGQYYVDLGGRRDGTQGWVANWINCCSVYPGLPQIRLKKS